MSCTCHGVALTDYRPSGEVAALTRASFWNRIQDNCKNKVNFHGVGDVLFRVCSHLPEVLF